MRLVAESEAKRAEAEAKLAEMEKNLKELLQQRTSNNSYPLEDRAVLQDQASARGFFQICSILEHQEKPIFN